MVSWTRPLLLYEQPFTTVAPTEREQLFYEERLAAVHEDPGDKRPSRWRDLCAAGTYVNCLWTNGCNTRATRPRVSDGGMRQRDDTVLHQVGRIHRRLEPPFEVAERLVRWRSHTSKIPPPNKLYTPHRRGWHMPFLFRCFFGLLLTLAWTIFLIRSFGHLVAGCDAPVGAGRKLARQEPTMAT